jgi:hypothetical protein
MKCHKLVEISRGHNFVCTEPKLKFFRRYFFLSRNNKKKSKYVVYLPEDRFHKRHFKNMTQTKTKIVLDFSYSRNEKFQHEFIKQIIRFMIMKSNLKMIFIHSKQLRVFRFIAKSSNIKTKL